jgi:hypothetical protein
MAPVKGREIHTALRSSKALLNSAKGSASILTRQSKWGRQSGAICNDLEFPSRFQLAKGFALDIPAPH